jgi:hypothetical protein
MGGPSSIEVAMHVPSGIRPLSRPITALIAACLLLMGGPAAAQELQQVVVVDPVSGISVALHGPATPQSQVAPGTTITIRFYLAVVSGSASTLSVFEITEADGGYDLDGGVEGAAQGTNGTVISSAEAVHQGHPARDFELAVADENGNAGLVLSRIVYTGAHVAQVQAVGPETQRALVGRLFAQLAATLDLGPDANASPGASPVASGAPMPSDPVPSEPPRLPPGG